jgi:hypothetical protein
MIYDNDNPDYALRGKAKGIRQVWGERGLWRKEVYDENVAQMGLFLLLCQKTRNRSGCDLGLNGECCATALLQSQRDFAEQKGRLQEGMEAAGHSVILYPKFHCELNFIERFWCAYICSAITVLIVFAGQVLPAAFKSVSTASINRYYQHC